MNATFLKHLAVRASAIAALLASATGVALAQKAKPDGPPVTTKGAVKSNEKAAKGQATAEAARVAARERKAARGEPRALLKGIKFRSSDKTAVRDIRHRYDRLFTDLVNSNNNLHRAGMADLLYRSKVDALRLRQRAEIRAALTAAHQRRYDINITRRDTGA